jgi:hypothetical protein
VPGREDGLGDLAAKAAGASGQEEDLGHLRCLPFSLVTPVGSP